MTAEVSSEVSPRKPHDVETLCTVDHDALLKVFKFKMSKN
jgi:hypothetical protein